MVQTLPMTDVGAVRAIFRYPVKSMQGESLPEAELSTGGILGDRVAAVLDADDGTVASAKRPDRWRSLLDCTATTVGDDIQVTLPDGSALRLADPDLVVALGALTGREVRLDRRSGPVSGTYDSTWPSIEGVDLVGDLNLPINLGGQAHGFVDLGVLHVLTTSALAAIDAPVERFRPSLLLDTGPEPGFVENDWTGRTMVIGDPTDPEHVVLRIEDPAPRCVMTTIAQGALPRDTGVLRRIVEHNRIVTPFGAFGCLGSYASVLRAGRIRPGAQCALSSAAASS